MRSRFIWEILTRCAIIHFGRVQQSLFTEVTAKKKIVAHTMEYQGGDVESSLRLRNYLSSDYGEYKKIYEECFHDMRTALQLFPVDCCDSQEELEHKKDRIYILEIDGKLIGSVAIYDNEIDDLVVKKSSQRMGYGKELLRFAVSYLQRNNISPIILHVTDWNQRAIKMYSETGFSIIKTEVFDFAHHF